MKPELWGGIECTVNRVGNSYFDQFQRSGHSQRISDLDRLAGLGFTTLRYPILWEKIQPDSPDEFDWSWTDERMAKLREVGIRPIVGLLHHGSGPKWTDLLDPYFAVKLARFAQAVAERYPWVEDYTPVNEPLTTARFSGLYGHWYPHRKDDGSFALALLNQVEGVVLSMEAIRSIVPQARLIQTEDLGRVYSTKSLRYQADFENQRRWLTFDLLNGRVDHRHPLWDFLIRSDLTEKKVRFLCDQTCSPDIYGINYYVTSERYLDENLDAHPVESHGANAFQAYADVAAVRVRPEGIDLDALLRETWTRYGGAMALTECHLGCTREEQVRWLMDAWTTGQRLQKEGYDIRAITVWALFGTYDWNNLVTSQDGVYESGAFDVRGPQPRPTLVATCAKSLIENGTFRHPILDSAGWWKRSQISDGGPHLAKVAEGGGILIFGGKGALGQTLVKICEARGLVYQALSRTEADVNQEPAVWGALERYRPWAVINLASYTMVDEAEFEQEKCLQVNVEAALSVARLCRERAIPYVSLSSDLVFSGTKDRPYLESDETNPLNFYGRSRQMGEEAIAKSYPKALIVRTSALFDSQSETQFVAHVLQGQGDLVVSDGQISPTFVPDLCQALLDLLLDGESGIWHLANEGATTWHQLAHLVCWDFGTSPPCLEVVNCESLPATRPRQSVLTSNRGKMMPTLENALGRFRTQFLPVFHRIAEHRHSL